MGSTSVKQLALHSRLVFLLISLVVLSAQTGCSLFEASPKPSKKVLTYVFLGHTYQNADSIDRRLPAFFDKKAKAVNGIDQFWLGGDMCSETTHRESNLDYLDDLFDLGHPNTHWTLGNHDVRNGNLQWITERTKRPTSYVAHSNGMTLIVMDNHYFQPNGDYDTSKVKAQYQMIEKVCDTIQFSSHLVILSHFVTWRHVPNIETPEKYANSDWSWMFFKLNPNEIYAKSVYPLLQKAKSKGVEVICIAGDMGQKAITYEGISADSIHFIGSGIASNTIYNEQFPTHGMEDKVLVLTHDLDKKSIIWEFESIEN